MIELIVNNVYKFHQNVAKGDRRYFRCAKVTCGYLWVTQYINSVLHGEGGGVDSALPPWFIFFW